MEDQPNEGMPLVSVIVPTYNSAGVIGRCLSAVGAQTYERVEVIVVDQSSGDDTIRIASMAGAHVLQVPAPAFYSPPTASRNTGAKRAQGSILYHLDSDMAPEPGVLEEAVELLARDDGLVALVVPEVDDVGGYWSRCKALERRCYWSDDAIESARIVRAATFHRVDGYDEELNSGEDFDIHRRYQTVGRTGRTSATVAHDLRGLGFRQAVRKKFQYGKTASLYFDKQGETGANLVRVQLAAFLRNRAELRRNPLIGLGMVGLKVSELAAGLTGAGAARLNEGRGGKDPRQNNLGF